MKMDYATMHKVEILAEALPYIQKFRDTTVVVKYGGAAMLDEKLKHSVIKDVVLLKLVGLRPVIVHGGGKDISRWVEKSGMEPKFINGLRVTDKATMEIAEMVLNRVNKELVGHVESLGVHAAGISGKDGGLLKVKKRMSDGHDLGFVGHITDVCPKIVHDLMDNDYIPIICPIGTDENYISYNINADDAACAIASSIHAGKLAFLTDTEGVFRVFTDKSTFIPKMTLEEAREFIAAGHATGGMLPKLTNCINALEAGVSRVHILDGRVPHCLMLEFFTDRGVGTAITNDGEEY